MMKFVFFGSSIISVTALEHLKQSGLVPSLVVTKPDSPQGRGLILKPSVVKEWCLKENVPVITPEKIKNPDFEEILKKQEASLAILVSYGKIIPETFINIFPKGIVNVHPSLLPLLRGPAPIEYTILNDMKDNVGVSIMLLDDGMDTGPILAQKRIEVENWPPSKNTLYKILSEEGAKLLVEILAEFNNGQISTTPQDNSTATYSKIIQKTDGEIKLTENAYQNFLKFKAYEGWPGTFMFVERNGKMIRVKITDATFDNNEFKILKVIPEGKKEMDYDNFLNI